MLNRSGKSMHHCLVPDLRERAVSFSSLSGMLARDFSYMAFKMLKPFLHLLVECFYHGRVLNCVSFFFCLSRDDHVTFILVQLKWIGTLINFWYVESSLRSRDQSCLIMLCDPFNVLSNVVC